MGIITDLGTGTWMDDIGFIHHDGERSFMDKNFREHFFRDEEDGDDGSDILLKVLDLYGKERFIKAINYYGYIERGPAWITPSP